MNLAKEEDFVFDKEKPQTKKIETYAEVFDIREKTSVVLVKISNGKTHQIRAHLAFVGNPIVGDGKYGRESDNKKFGKKYQQLFASRIIFHFSQGVLAYLDKKEIK